MQMHWGHDFIAWWGCLHSTLAGLWPYLNHHFQVGCMKDGCPVGDNFGQVRESPVITSSWLNIFYNSWTSDGLTTHPSSSACHTLQLTPWDVWLSTTEDLRANSSCYHKFEVILSCKTAVVNCWLSCHLLTFLIHTNIYIYIYIYVCPAVCLSVCYLIYTPLDTSF